MRRSLVWLVVVGALWSFGGTAASQPDGNWRRECYGPGGPTFEELRTTKCVKHGDGPWELVEDSAGFAGLGIGLGEIIFFGLLLALTPGFVGAVVASNADVPRGAGFLIGTFGSWLGVIALYLYGHSQKRTV